MEARKLPARSPSVYYFKERSLVKNIYLALGAALLLLFVSQSVVAAENRINSFVSIDEIHCYDAINDVTTTLVYGTSVATLDPPRYNDDGLEFIVYGLTHGSSCLAPVGSVSEGQGWIHFDDTPPVIGDSVDVDFIDEDVQHGHTLPEPAVVIGTNVVNTVAYCRAAPLPDAEIVATLQPGNIVTEFADGVQDGWQWVGLEATDCFVWAELLGYQPEEPTVIPPVTSTDDSHVVIEETAVYEEEKVQLDTPSVVTQLPSTGSGSGNSMEAEIPSQSMTKTIAVWSTLIGIVAITIGGPVCAAKWLEYSRPYRVNVHDVE